MDSTVPNQSPSDATNAHKRTLESAEADISTNGAKVEQNGVNGCGIVPGNDGLNTLEEPTAKRVKLDNAVEAAEAPKRERVKGIAPIKAESVEPFLPLFSLFR